MRAVPHTPHHRCAQLGRRAVDQRQPWTTSEQFKREPRSCARAAMRAAGVPLVYATSVEPSGGLGGVYGGSGLTAAGRTDGFSSFR